MDKLSGMMDSVSAQGQEAILCGDFNCCFMSSSRNDPDCRRLKSLFSCFDFKQIITEPTRITKDTKSLIDLIAVNCPVNIRDSGVISSHLSDHELVYCVRKINWKRAPSQIKTFRNYAKYDSKRFSEDLEGVDWNSALSPNGQAASGVDGLWNGFKSAFIRVADFHAPVIQKRVRGIENCPWLNKDIKAIMRQRDYFHSKAKKTNLTEDWASYRCFRNRATNCIKKAKAAYNRKLIERSENDHNAFWKTLKKILPGEKKTASPNICVQGTMSSDKKLIANAFNGFFINTAARLCESVRSSCGTAASSHQPGPCRYPPFKFEDVSEEFVSAQLRGLKAGKAVGCDNIPARLLVDSATTVAKPLTKIINYSLRHGEVPREWKSARVIPLFKKGKADDMDNYRPISILPAISKVLERVVHHQLLTHLQRHNILSPYQSGFRKRHSTEWAAMCFADSICRNIDMGMMAGAVFIDLRKAFDTVHHDVLLRKLSGLGVTEDELKWFTNYLSDRSQVVDFLGVSSSSEPVFSGVPQGSILGPLLFIIHLNDLPGAVASCSVLMYADDTVLFCTGRQASTIEATLNRELNQIESWLRENNLFINVTKTESMIFGTSQRLANIDSFSININGSPIKRVSEFKYLGVVFDDRLSWNEHVKSVLSKAGKRVGMLGRVRRHVTTYSANTIYITMIRPIIEYCSGVWACCGEVNSGNLERLQNRAARTVARTPNSSSALSYLKWQSLNSRRDNNIFKLVKRV